jgi:transcriptional regulator with XRE-family HTH domain
MPRTWDSALEAVREKLVETGMTYYQLSDATGINRPSLIRFLNGTTGLQGTTVDKLLAYFNLQVTEAPTRRPKRKAR